ncbi:hypothetical protein Acin_1368 [Acidaminococcus intestini RyC-MR95]|uniref:Rad50/SbcC-type AAA domain-containing protein n=2 Tax=Bacillota TaxID=1239 RepID=G4Q988_ACIIR|nr:hypothetical protein Acin_1368 [Acidaminococcus intestini RyC-MR95]
MMGAGTHRFDVNLKVEKIQIGIDVNGEGLSISRDVNTQSFEVISHVDGIETSTYKLKGGKKNPPINDVWMKLFDIPLDTKILKTQEGKPQALTVRTFYHTFIIDEDRIHDKASVLKGKHGLGGKVGTPTLTALLYLGTGNNYLPNLAFIDPKIKKAKDEGVLKIVNRGMGFLERQKSSFDDALPLLQPVELQNKINQTIDEIGAAKGILKEALNLCREIGEEINKVMRQISEDEVLMNRNQLLLSQYKADIKRLTFIAEGNMVSQKIKTIERCPFCNGELPHEHEEDCIGSAIAEEQKIEMQVRDLQSVQESIQEEYAALSKKRDMLINQRNEQEEKIRGELEPKIQQLKKQLDDFKISLRFAEMNTMIDQFSTFLKQERDAIENEETADIHLNVKEKFKEVFKELLDTEVDELLKYCNYQNYLDSYFDIDSYDIVVNGHEKKSQGKGFRAFLNTILAVAMENCLEKMGHYHPTLFVIDSPILSLKEKDSKRDSYVTEPMKEHLFRYFLTRADSPQTIVIENEIPSIDYEGANLIHFTKNKGIGRYGLIDGYQE